MLKMLYPVNSKLSLKNSVAANASQINSIGIDMKPNTNVGSMTTQVVSESIRQLTRIRRS